MNHLEALPRIADRQLGGLKAEQDLKVKILCAASQTQAAPVHRGGVRWQPVLAGCCAFALCLCVGLIAYFGSDGAQPVSPVPSASVLDSQPAGDANNAPVARALLDVPSGSISMSGGTDTPAFASLFESEKSGNFPLLMVDGAAYRMLKSPKSLNQSLVGESLGTVSEYTLEPALSGGGIVSNSASQGETVYAVSGMQGAMVTANVDGKMRVYQRVSFSGTAVLGSEGLADTLSSSSQVTGLTLSGVGSISDAATAQSLMDTLLSNAVFAGSNANFGAKQSLQITLQNGLTLQMMVGDDTVSACGMWSCPEFFEAFTVAMNEM